MTALHLAARFSSASVIKAFVKAGAKVDARDDKQRTPLHYAVRFNTSEDMIRVLIECGANILHQHVSPPSPHTCYLFGKHPATTRQYIMHSICAALVYYKAVIILIIF